MISDNHSQTCVSSNYHCFFFNVATCFHLVFYRLFSLKCKFSYHFSYVIQIWHFIELLLLSGVIPANLFLEDQILNKEPKYFRDLSTLSSLKKNKVIRKYWFQIQITFFWQARVWTARNTKIISTYRIWLISCTIMSLILRLTDLTSNPWASNLNSPADKISEIPCTFFIWQCLSISSCSNPCW